VNCYNVISDGFEQSGYAGLDYRGIGYPTFLDAYASFRSSRISTR
jgi:hypothetical protein